MKSSRCQGAHAKKPLEFFNYISNNISLTQRKKVKLQSTFQNICYLLRAKPNIFGNSLSDIFSSCVSFMETLCIFNHLFIIQNDWTFYKSKCKTVDYDSCQDQMFHNFLNYEALRWWEGKTKLFCSGFPFSFDFSGLTMMIVEFPQNCKD